MQTYYTLHMKHTRKLLFLDFDGVLHPGQSGTFCYVPAFEAVMREFPDVAIVITSTWRQQAAHHELCGYFSPDIAARIEGMIPVLMERHGTASYTEASRYTEILAYRAQRRSHGLETQAWLAVDDEAAQFPAYCPNLLLLDTLDALKPANCDRLREALMRMTAG